MPFIALRNLFRMLKRQDGDGAMVWTPDLCGEVKKKGRVAGNPSYSLISLNAAVKMTIFYIYIY